MKNLIGSIACLLFLVGCGTQPARPLPELLPTDIPVSTAISATATLKPTHTPLSPTPMDAPAIIAQVTESHTPKLDSQPTATPGASPTPEPTATPTPEPDWLNTFGRTVDNLMYMGNPNAPVTMIDFSDFM